MTSLTQMRFSDLSLDQLPINSVLYRPWDDADSLFSSFLSLRSISPIYTERKQYKEKLRERNDTEKKMKWSQSNAKKRREQSWKKMKSGTSEIRQREHGFYVIPIEIDFYGRVYPSFVIHPVELVYLSDVSFDVISNDLVTSYSCIFYKGRHPIESL